MEFSSIETEPVTIIFPSHYRRNLKEKIEDLDQKINNFLNDRKEGRYSYDSDRGENREIEEECEEMMKKRNLVEGMNVMNVLDRFNKECVRVKNSSENQKKNKESGRFSFAELDSPLN